MSQKQLSQRAVYFIYLFEKFGFAAFFFYYAYVMARTIIDNDQFSIVQTTWAMAEFNSRPFVLELNYLIRNIVLMLFNFSCAILMLANRRPEHPPQRIVHIALPFLTTLFTFAYNITRYLPPEMTMRRVPDSMVGSLTLAAAFLVLAGWTTAFFSLWYLRSSFAVFVQGRSLVHAGPYAYVRHPMYSGYMLMFAGLLLFNCSIAWFLLLFAHVCLMVYRARLEESFLVEMLPGYREYQQQTGFLFPRISSVPQPAETTVPPRVV